MIFADLPLDQCEGAILAHSQRVGAAMFKKGRCLDKSDIAALRSAGLASVTVAKLEAGDAGENEAAAALASLLAAPGLEPSPSFTGRVNLHAAAAGVLEVDPVAVDAVNAIDEAVTLATLPRYAPIAAGQMAATVKIIPYAVRRDILSRVLDMAKDRAPIIRLKPYRARPVALIQTLLPGIKPSVLDKSLAVMTARLSAMGQAAPSEHRCPHETGAVAAALRQALDEGAGFILLIGASAISDRRDVIPEAVTRLGGEILHFGMPVDPGNLLLLARIGDVPILGLPGCARSAKPNGCDWVMTRLLADIAVDAGDVRALGVGGLLAELPSRPQPREAKPTKADGPSIAAIVLAAGRSSRMGQNKLMLDYGGKPILAHIVDHALAAGFGDLIVVIGHQAGKARAALAGRKVRFVEARDYQTGMAASLKAGIRALGPDTDAAMILLGDMPGVSPRLMHRMIDAFNPAEGRAIVVPVCAGKRGNPVLFDRRFFAEILAVEGDVGARHLVGAYQDLVAEVPAPAQEIFLDVDTPDAYRDLVAERPA